MRDPKVDAELLVRAVALANQLHGGLTEFIGVGRAMFRDTHDYLRVRVNGSEGGSLCHLLLPSQLPALALPAFRRAARSLTTLAANVVTRFSPSERVGGPVPRRGQFIRPRDGPPRIANPLKPRYLWSRPIRP